MEEFDPTKPVINIADIEEMDRLGAELAINVDTDGIGAWGYSTDIGTDIPPEVEADLNALDAVQEAEVSEYNQALIEEFGSMAVFLEMRFGEGITEEEALGEDMQTMFEYYETEFSEFDPDDGMEGMGSAALAPTPLPPDDTPPTPTRSLVIPDSENELEPVAA